jgi:hypothetical protein
MFLKDVIPAKAWILPSFQGVGVQVWTPDFAGATAQQRQTTPSLPLPRHSAIARPVN